MKQTFIEYVLLPDSHFEDSDEYPTDEATIADLAGAMQRFEEWERGERELRITERTLAKG